MFECLITHVAFETKETSKCSLIFQVEDIVDEIDRVFRSLPDDIRYHCIKTKAKCLANEPEHKVKLNNAKRGNRCSSIRILC